MTPQLVLTSRWRLATGAEPVWCLLTDIEAWPRWWRHARQVRVLQRAAGSPVGDVFQIDWTGAQPWALRARLLTTEVDRPSCLAGQCLGRLGGMGAWFLEPTANGEVDVTCRREVDLQPRWMRRCAPVLGPAIAWNHFLVMRSGARGMAMALGCGLSHMREWSGQRRA